jgi:hypothetical protein
MNIKTSYIDPPIPYRHWDWVACIDGQEEDGINGYGRTEAEAIQDLKNQLNEG